MNIDRNMKIIHLDNGARAYGCLALVYCGIYAREAKRTSDPSKCNCKNCLNAHIKGEAARIAANNKWMKG